MRSQTFTSQRQDNLPIKTAWSQHVHIQRRDVLYDVWTFSLAARLLHYLVTMVFNYGDTLLLPSHIFTVLSLDLENYDNDTVTLLITGSTPLLPGDKVFVVGAIS